MRRLVIFVLALLQAALPVIATDDESLCEPLSSGYYLHYPLTTNEIPSLVTSSITYCATPDMLIIQEFEFQYFKNNRSFSFTLSATNTAPNLNASANLILNTYGMTPLNYTFNLCDVLQGQLCPLPQYNVTGTVSLPIPPTVDLPIPEIAYKIPDLEAVAQIVLRRVETGEVAVCLQSTLSNGWSLHIPAVSTATGLVALLSLLSSIVHSFFYPQSSPAVFRAITTFSFFQQIALSGMLHLNFPSAYIAFVTNFAWSFGLFSQSGAIQSAIERMRRGTGSTLSEESQAPVSYTDRTLSPYNLAAIRTASHYRSIDIGSFVGGTSNKPPDPTHSFVTPAVITSNGETLEPGIPVYVNSMNVATGNAFMTVFFTTLFMFIVFGLLHFAILGGLKYAGSHGRAWADKRLATFRPVFASNAVRLVRVCLLPVISLAIFQWILHDSWLSTLLSVITLLAVLLALAYPTYLIIRQVLANGGESLNEETVQKGVQGALIGPFLPARYYFFLFAILAPLVRASFASLGRSNGFIQVIGLVTLELLYLLLLLFLRPSLTRRADVFEVTIAIIRLIGAAGLLPFVKEKLDVDAIPRTAIGIGIAVVYSVGVLLVSFNVLLHTLPWRWAWNALRGKKKPKTDGDGQTRDTDSEVEKGADPVSVLPAQ